MGLGPLIRDTAPWHCLPAKISAIERGRNCEGYEVTACHSLRAKSSKKTSFSSYMFDLTRKQFHRFCSEIGKNDIYGERFALKTTCDITAHRKTLIIHLEVLSDGKKRNGWILRWLWWVLFWFQNEGKKARGPTQDWYLFVLCASLFCSQKQLLVSVLATSWVNFWGQTAWTHTQGRNACKWLRPAGRATRKYSAPRLIRVFCADRVLLEFRNFELSIIKNFDL